MKLLLRNHCSNEFLPGCECTVVQVDQELLDLVARRAESFRQLRLEDTPLAGIRWWDGRPRCFSVDEAMAARITGDREAQIEDWLEERGGWALLPDLDVPDEILADTDCARMVACAGRLGVEVGWTCRVGSDEVWTDGVDVRDVLGRIAEGGDDGT